MRQKNLKNKMVTVGLTTLSVFAGCTMYQRISNIPVTITSYAKMPAEYFVEEAKSIYTEVNEMADNGELDKSGSESEGSIVWKDNNVVRKVVTYSGSSADGIKDYKVEYYYDKNESLVFAFAANDGKEYRYYYDGNGYLCRYIGPNKKTQDFESGLDITASDEMEDFDIAVELFYGSQEYIENGEEKYIANEVDLFIYNAMVNSSDSSLSQEEFAEAVGDKINNSEEYTKTSIAVSSISNIRVNDVEGDEITYSEREYDEVEQHYYNLFGEENALIELPEIRDPSDNGMTEQMYAGHYGQLSTGNFVIGYRLGEDDVYEDSEVIDVSKDGEECVVTKEYHFYNHWSHETPDYTFNVDITLTENSDSAYGYNITGINVEN